MQSAAVFVSRESKPRLAGLDLLRLLAITLVLGRHIPQAPETAGMWRAFFLTWQRGGWVGVDLFFVLSGFLISGLLFTEYASSGRISIGRFYIRRGWKIYPPFFTLMAFTVVLHAAVGRPASGSALASEFLFLQSYWPGVWNHTWSLAVEEHFYFLLPLVLSAIAAVNRRARRPLEPVVTFTACVLIYVFYLRLANWQNQPLYSHHTHLFPTHLRLDSLMFGVAMSYVYHFHKARFVETLAPWRRFLIATGILLFVPAFVFQLETTPFIFTAGLTVFYIASAMLVSGVLLYRFPDRGILVHLATLGSYSYSIYLWHMFVIGWAIPLFELGYDMQFPFSVRLVLYVGGSLSLGALMAKLIEVPALRVRDRWFPSRSSGAPQRLASSQEGVSAT
jgi:peptidoglycan/LPS O-acetylase OafA/YrhL